MTKLTAKVRSVAEDEAGKLIMRSAQVAAYAHISEHSVAQQLVVGKRGRPRCTSSSARWPRRPVARLECQKDIAAVASDQAILSWVSIIAS